MKRTNDFAFVTVFLLILILGSISSVDAIGIEYLLDSQGLEVTNGALELNIEAEGSPHFRIFDRGVVLSNYHMLFINAFEYVDNNHDGVYISEHDLLLAPFVPLQALDWSFGGFISGEDSGSVVALRFNLSTVDSTIPLHPNFWFNIQNHISIENQSVLKFDISIEGWSWQRMDSSLAIGMVIATGSQGENLTDRPDVDLFNRVISFDNAFISSPTNATFGGQQAGVNVSLGGANAESDGELLYFCFPNFGDNRLEYDPTFGLLQMFNYTPTVTSSTTTTPLIRLLDVDRIILMSIGVTTIFALVLIVRSRK
ncbi:MAG: hypothetical protein ACTSWA_07670 [Candidatus Thorarchaeota archaeon]